ncbi:MAG: hypothetical protein B6D61_14685 [Bacteroidetes bacterium 4484_249]|nr:MAG: hypothetical protein B6D61_14685 [Bacteroidetes bacterium 4484_249]
MYYTDPIATDIDETYEDIISVYPNPSDGIFNLTAFHDITGSQNLLGLEIINNTGKTIYTMENVPLKIDLSNQPKGIYFIKIETKNGIYTKKILIL